MTISSLPKALLMVVGMHRSGTSAVCAALAASGVSFGSQLLDPMAGVNDEGFWEDARVVALNDQLLALTQSTWFAPTANMANIEWSDTLYDSLREQAAHILESGFGASSPQAVKDPRFCLTLPFWLACCEKLGITVGICAVHRSPLEVASSLERRDGFPLGYSLRLYLLYCACMHKFLPFADTLHVRYEDLLLNPPSVIERLAAKFELGNLNRGVATVVRGELRHQFADVEFSSDGVDLADCAEPDLAGLARIIELRYPVESTLGDFAHRFTLRGVELQRIGQAHAFALATLDERDEQIRKFDRRLAQLGDEYSHALQVLHERDEQIREFDRRLAQLGDEHSHALQVLRERDAEIARLKQLLDKIRALPGMGFLMNALLKTKKQD